MKVLNLQCAHQHSFEGWFASEDDFQSQLSRGLVECPMCDDKGIQKMPSAPRLNFGAQQAVSTAAGSASAVSVSSAVSAPDASAASTELVAHASSGAGHGIEHQAAFLKALRHVVANTEDVGDKFASQARRMHYGEEKARNIRGQVSPREAIELIEEGIAVMPLTMPAAVKETLQ